LQVKIDRRIGFSIRPHAGTRPRRFHALREPHHK